MTDGSPDPAILPSTGLEYDTYTSADLNAIDWEISQTAKLRLALNALDYEAPVQWWGDSEIVTQAFGIMRDAIEQMDLDHIRALGPSQYLVIRPLAPDAGAQIASQAATHIRALDDLGLVIRLTAGPSGYVTRQETG